MPPRNDAIFWLTTFLGAFLMFLVQPMIAKIILPWFGGTAAVWTACMMFFQVVLVLGYGYAHLSNRFLSRRTAFNLHAAILAIACFSLPIVPHQSLQPTGDSNLNWAVSVTLLLTVGLPYFALAANSTLVQIWYQSLTDPNVIAGHRETSSANATRAGNQNTYRLYAVSNLGSMLALVIYPFCIEPLATLTAQTWVWSIAFVAFSIISLIAAWPTRRATDKPSKNETQPVAALDIAIWFALASTASVVLLATTNLMCQEIASAPFLWILPLAAYLASFILCFQNTRFYHRGVFIPLMCVFVVLGIAVIQTHIYLSIVIQIGVMTGVCFFVAMVCHGELERTKPPAIRLTTFYLTLSVGGAAGGVFTAVIGPIMFDGFYEFQIAVLAVLAIVLYQIFRASASNSNSWASSAGKIAATAGIGLTAAITLSSYMLQTNIQTQNDVVMRMRNHYGVMMVKQNQTYRRFVSGNVDHGGQFLDPQKSLKPSGYYTPNSGVGIAFNRIREYRSTPRSTSGWTSALPSPLPKTTDRSRASSLDVGVIGMGIGAMLAWCQPDDQFTFYELNPAVHEIAKLHFSYLRHFEKQTRVLIGDGRLLLERDTDAGGVRKFDLIFVDAFSSDAIPQHLLTSQCVDQYLEHLNQDGILIFHITNRFVDLRPVIATLAAEKNLASFLRENKNTPTDSGTRWVLLSRQSSVLNADWMKPLQADWPHEMPQLLWTDDFAPLAPVTIWNTGIDVEDLRRSQSDSNGQIDDSNDQSGGQGHNKGDNQEIDQGIDQEIDQGSDWDDARHNLKPKVEPSAKIEHALENAPHPPSAQHGVPDE